jgi:hypothetical protein
MLFKQALNEKHIVKNMNKNNKYVWRYRALHKKVMIC